MRKMPVSSSHLALRFYKCHGWTKEILGQYLLRGQMVDVWKDQPVRDYWFMDHTADTKLDMDRLYAERISQMIRYCEFATKHKTDLEYLHSFNW